MSTLDEQEELVRREDLLEALAKQDHRHPRGGWAPGEYMNKCIGCDTLFFGDKRAVECSDCAYAEEEEPVTQDVTKCDHGTQFYNPATNKCVRCLQADLTRLEDHYKRMHVYEEQCNALSQEYGKSLIAEGVPAIRAERDYLKYAVEELKTSLQRAQRIYGITISMSNSFDVSDPFKSYEGVVTGVGHADHIYRVESVKLNADVKALVTRAELAEDRLNWLLNHAMVVHLGANVYDVRVDTTWEKVGVEDPKFRELGLVECATILLDKVRAKAETKA